MSNYDETLNKYRRPSKKELRDKLADAAGQLSQYYYDPVAWQAVRAAAALKTPSFNLLAGKLRLLKDEDAAAPCEGKTVEIDGRTYVLREV